MANVDSTREMQDTARAAAETARKAGAQQAAVSAARVRNVQVDWRDGKMERVKEATTRGLSVELYVDGRYSTVSTSDLRPDAVRAFVETAVAMARKLEKDPFRSLPDPRLYAGQARVDLDLLDPGQGALTPAARRERARAAEEGARAVKGSDAFLSVSAGVSDSLSEVFRVHTNGFEGTRKGTTFVVSSGVSVKDPDGRRPEDSAYAFARHLAAVPPPATVGKEAAERALACIGARKAESAAMTMVVDARAAGRLVSTLLGPLSGGALQQKQSCLEGKLGQAVGSPLLDVADDPLVPRGLDSRLFDSEGIAARRFPVFEKGVLTAYYLDTYYAKKLGMEPTTRSSSNLAWTLGTKGREGLLADARDAILVTGFLGGNSNSTTGDFSLGVQGFRIRDGRIAEPVAEMNVSGNLLDVWKRLVAVGNDPYPYSTLRTPTLVFEKVQFAGA
ncbi:MAG TPA: TldD/PmbA family protein [Anaeromyxobacteraceae bacterium]|nr:TldD/PmbA family protein [Anaeromyxobacteraceae bacterium]